MLFPFPKKIKIYGLPRSGTNFLEFMISKNLNLDIALFEYGWKHDIPIKNLPIPSLTITKNIYSWLWSIYNFAQSRTKIFHIENGISFSNFIKREYIWDSDISGKGSPKVFHHAENPIVYWNNMNNAWSKSSLVVKYESLLLDTDRVLDQISSHLKVQRLPKSIWPNDTISPACATKVGVSEYNVFNKTDFIKNKEYMKYFDKEMISFIDHFVDAQS